MVSTALVFMLRQAKQTEEMEIKQFMLDHFYTESPLAIAFGAVNAAPTLDQCPKIVLENSNDFAIIAKDSQGRLIGVSLVTEKPTSWRDSTKSVENKNLLEFLHFVEEHAKLDKLPDRTTELRVLSVCPTWRQLGLARLMAEESMKVARSCGFKAMRICCTSEFSARLARRLGWKEHYLLPYKDYTSPSGKDVQIKPIPPHEYVYYYYINL